MHKWFIVVQRQIRAFLGILSNFGFCMEKKFRPTRMENRHFCLSERPSHFSKGALRADIMAYCLAATASDKAESGNRMYHCACLGQPISAEQLRALRRVQNALRALLGHVRRAAPAAWVAHWHSSEPEQDQQERLSAPRLQSGGQSTVSQTPRFFWLFLRSLA